MGLIKFLADLSTSNKLAEKYGLGAAFLYNDMVANAEIKKEIQLQELQNQEIINEEFIKDRNEVTNQIKNFINDYNDILCYNHRKKLQFMVNEVSTCKPEDYPFVNEELKKTLSKLVYFILINEQIVYFKDQIKDMDEKIVSNSKKAKALKIIDDILESENEDESRLKIKDLSKTLGKNNIEEKLKPIFEKVEETKKQFE